MIWALEAVRRRAHAETSLDLADAALRTLELWRTEPDFMVGGRTRTLTTALADPSDPSPKG